MNKIGVFFINNNEIILDSIPYEKGRVLNDLYDSNADHWKFFDSISFKFNTNDYINVPRGRVIYDKANDNGIIYIDRCFLLDEEIINKVIKLFNIKNYVLKTDIHYQCPNCLGDIWED